MSNNQSRNDNLKTSSRLRDNHNRQFNYLRISITDRCNLNCLYCAPNPCTPKLAHQEILRYEEIMRLVRIVAPLGISKVRITGGEPLVRKGVFQLLSELSRIPEITDISLTTNGFYLNDHLDQILKSGVKRINISLDTLKASTYRHITGKDGFTKVWEGIRNAHQAGFSPIKINVVALRGINDHEFEMFARLTFQYPFHIRFIEYMPIGDSLVDPKRLILTPEIKACVSQVGELEPVTRNAQDGPADRFKIRGALGEIGFISPISHHFCQSCNRLRLTAAGYLKTCLLSDAQFDIKGPLRAGLSDDALAKLILTQVSHKPPFHQLQQNLKTKIACQMSAVGG